MKCLILAGGFATRLYPLTINRAKALLEFKGKPIITYIIERIPSNIDILVSTNARFEGDFFLWQNTLERPVELCIEEAMTDEKKKGAVGAIDYWIQEKKIDEDLMVIASDNYFEFDLDRMLADFNGFHPLIAVHDVGDKEKACEIGKACQVGLAIIEEKRLVRLDEKPPFPTSSIISSGIYILPSRIFPLLTSYNTQSKRDNLGSFISHLLQQGEEIRAFVFNEVWMDIGDEIKRGNIII
jgi:glucose-1-phosphate thymidylyltransferase